MNRARCLAPLAVLLLLSCDTREKIANAALAQGCYLNSDCAQDLVCAFQRCHRPCDKDTDCTPIADQLLCVQADRPFKVCLLPQESTCVYNTDCQAGQVCAVDLRCHPECLTERDCAPEQVCASGNCAKRSQVSDAGTLIAAADGGVPGVMCNYSSDCPGTLVCRSGTCMAECKSQRDCPLGADCEKGSCAGRLATDGGSGSGAACLLNSDCPLGQLCGLDGRCRYECLEARDCDPGACCYQRSCRRGAACSVLLTDGGPSDGGPTDAGYCLNDLGCNDSNFCNGIELCVNNRCQKAAHPICDDFNPCTIDMCDAAGSGTCAYATIAIDAGDNDHDGHRAVQCGGSSDDCDDDNPNVFFGHPEDCDFVDNNCNGSIDEGLWRERSGSRISLHGSAIYPDWVGRPGVVRVDGGFLAVVASDTFNGALEAYRLDQNLALVQGPVPLFGSATQWSTPPGSPTIFGKRILRPRIAVNPAGEVISTAWVGDAPGVTTCAPASKFVLHTPVYRSDTLLNGLRRWDDVDTENVSAACPTTVAPEQYYPRITSAAIAWSPAVSRWVALWGTTPTTNQTSEMQAAYFDADGGLVNRHDVLQAPDSNLYFTNYYTGVPAPWMVPGPSGVFVAFDSSLANEPRYMVMDPSLNSRLTPVRDIYQAGARIAAVGESNLGVFIVTRVSNLTTAIRFFSPTTGLQVAGPWTLTPLSSPPGNPNHGFDSTTELAIAPLQDGFVAMETRWPNASFAFISSKNDGGFVSTDLIFPATPRSGFTIVPIDDRTVGALWTDGELKRLLMECAP